MLGELTLLMHDAHDEFFKTLDFDESHVENALATAVFSDAVFGAALVDMEEERDKIRGFVIAHVDATLWSRAPVAKIAMCYLRAEDREAEHLHALLESVEKWATRSRIRHIMFTQTADDLVIAGPQWQELGGVYVKELKK